MTLIYYLSFILTLFFGYAAFGTYTYGYVKKKKIYFKNIPLFIIFILFFVVTAIIWGMTRNYVKPFWAN